ncbi:S-layer homology domain-containing protein [Jeotgalibacillus sp. JSM ZJ347]|uniref:S-layer homology domain-containing protein n=1 Tax=Jeotgalibacillus sp. JSM ZJ347 TaxID=3342117 RepID=UPI0035A9A600
MNLLKKSLIGVIGAGVLSTGVAFSADAESVFTDVSESNDQYDVLERSYFKTILSGYSRDDLTGKVEVRPYAKVTRAQAAKMLTVSLGFKNATQELSPFPDVTEYYWGHDYITEAAALGIVNGYSNGKFIPGQVLNRAQAAKMIVDAFDLPFNKNEDDTGFTDVPEDDWSAPYVKSLVDAGITVGTSSTTFSPDQEVSRYQLAAFIDRVYESQELTDDMAVVQVRGTFNKMKDTYYDNVAKSEPRQPVYPYENFRDEMLESITTAYEPTVIENYKQQCRACDGLIYTGSFLSNVDLDVIQNTEDTIQVRDLYTQVGLVPSQQTYVEIKKVDGKWKVNDYKIEYLNSDELPVQNLTIEEAANYLESIDRSTGWGVQVYRYEYLGEEDGSYIYYRHAERYSGEIRIDKVTGLTIGDY